MSDTATSHGTVRIGISACLLGQEVRFDSGHKRDGFLVDTFGKFVEWVSVCPEVELGLGTPRETMRLVRDGKGELAPVRLVMPKSGLDWTEPMRTFAVRRADQLAHEDLDGYVLKKDSPSCGMERVKIYDPHGSPTKNGRGLFAQALISRFPLLPVEEEGRLSDPRLRENFIERVFAYRRLRNLFAGRWTVGALMAFHTAHKLTLLSHSTTAYQGLGRLVAASKSLSRSEVRERYEAEFMDALRAIATTRRHTNVLFHMLGYFKKLLDADSRAELVSAVEDYRNGLVPLIVPITLIRHHVRVHGVSYLAGQIYLQPHPRELMLRNHV